mmetsp:Transcript_12599/g.30637  ORF Transcript_12599/g.30637 Transcript_12599/m.30637 type:complete len:305 (-) Transcript_12599:112-1026(-)
MIRSFAEVPASAADVCDPPLSRPQSARKPGLALLHTPGCHGHEFLCGCGVQRYAMVKVALGGSHLDGDGKPLEHLICTNAHDVETHNLLLGPMADELHGHGNLFVHLAHGVVHGLEFCLVDLEAILAVLVHCLRLCQAHSANGRVGEDHCWDSLVLEARVGLPTEETIREAAARGNGDGRQLPGGVGRVAEGMDTRHICALVLIHLDEAVFICLHACRLQPDALGNRGTPDGKEHLIHLTNRGAVSELYRELAVGALLDCRDLVLPAHVHPGAVKLLIHNVLDNGVKAVAQHFGAAAHEARLGP